MSDKPGLLNVQNFFCTSQYESGKKCLLRHKHGCAIFHHSVWVKVRWALKWTLSSEQDDKTVPRKCHGNYNCKLSRTFSFENLDHCFNMYNKISCSNVVICVCGFLVWFGYDSITILVFLTMIRWLMQYTDAVLLVNGFSRIMKFIISMMRISIPTRLHFYIESTPCAGCI